MSKYPILIVTALVSVVLDQWTKHLVYLGFYWGESVAIWQGYFNLTYVRNTGAAFGLLHRAPAWFRDPFFIFVPLTVLAFISVLYYRLKRKDFGSALAFSLIIGGALGNLIDRLRFGFVIDFLDFHWKNAYHWPAFNVADSCIVVGVGLLFIQSFRHPSGA